MVLVLWGFFLKAMEVRMLKQFEVWLQIGLQSGGQRAVRSGGDTQVTKCISFESLRSDPGVEERERRGT